MAKPRSRQPRIGLLVASALSALTVACPVRATPTVAEPCGFKLVAPVEQGRLVPGRADPTCRVRVDRREVRVSASGYFAIGKVWTSPSWTCQPTLRPAHVRLLLRRIKH